MKFLNWLFEQKKDKELIVLIGLPASGKSTYIKKMKGYEVVSNDHVVEDFAQKKGITYTEAFHQLNKDLVKGKVRKKFDDAVKSGKNIIIDNTSMTKSQRGYYVSNVPPNYKKIAVIFKISDSELRKRLDKRAKETGKVIPDDVIEYMKKNYESPTKGEFDEIKRAT